MSNIEKTCSKCGAVYADKDQYCRACGNNSGTKQKSNYPMQSLLLISIAIISALGFITYSMIEAKSSADFKHPEIGESSANTMNMQNMMADVPDDYEGLVQHGNISMDNGRYAMAIEYYRKALSIDSSSLDVWTDQGACFHALGLNDSALTNFDRVLSVNPDHPIANFNMGVVYHSMNNMEKTRYYWTKFLELNPDSPIADTLRSLIEEI